jgi:hypothetical protein
MKGENESKGERGGKRLWIFLKLKKHTGLSI